MFVIMYRSSSTVVSQHVSPLLRMTQKSECFSIICALIFTAKARLRIDDYVIFDCVSWFFLWFFKKTFSIFSHQWIKTAVFVSFTAKMSRKISSSSEQKPDNGKPTTTDFKLLKTFTFSYRFSLLPPESSAALCSVHRRETRLWKCCLLSQSMLVWMWDVVSSLSRSAVRWDENSVFALRAEEKFQRWRSLTCKKRCCCLKESKAKARMSLRGGVCGTKSASSCREWTSNGLTRFEVG